MIITYKNPCRTHYLELGYFVYENLTILQLMQLFCFESFMITLHIPFVPTLFAFSNKLSKQKSKETAPYFSE